MQNKILTKKWIVCFHFIMLSLIIHAQTAYIAYDSSTKVGIRLIDGGRISNTLICKEITSKEIVDYTPYEVTQYGFSNGKTYVSKEIERSGLRQRFFLERIFKGETSLYLHRYKGGKTFYIEKDSTLFVEIPRVDDQDDKYKDQLLNLFADCPAVNKAILNASYNAVSMKRLLDRYNFCEDSPLPHFRVGVEVGYEVQKLLPVKELKNEPMFLPREYYLSVPYLPGEENVLKYSGYDYQGSIFYTVFMDLPLSDNCFAFHPELSVSKHGYSYNIVTESQEVDYVINLTTMRVPLSIRFVSPFKKFRPYFDAGVLFSYNLKNNFVAYETVIAENIIDIQTFTSVKLIRDFQMGYSVGAGIETPISNRCDIYFGIRHLRENWLMNTHYLGASSFRIATGLSF